MFHGKDHSPGDGELFLRWMLRIIQPAVPLPPLRQFASRLRHFRSPSECIVPEKILREASFKKLHISGDHNPAYEGITNRLAGRLGGERLIIRGGGHTPHMTGEPSIQPCINSSRVERRAAAGPGWLSRRPDPGQRHNGQVLSFNFGQLGLPGKRMDSCMATVQIEGQQYRSTAPIRASPVTFV